MAVLDVSTLLPRERGREGLMIPSGAAGTQALGHQNAVWSFSWVGKLPVSVGKRVHPECLVPPHTSRQHSCCSVSSGVTQGPEVIHRFATFSAA